MQQRDEIEKRVSRFSELIERSESALRSRPGNALLQENLKTVVRLKDRLSGRLNRMDGPSFSDRPITPFQAKYFAEMLTRRIPFGADDQLASVMVDARVDLNPHQVEAALFAFKSPLSNGAILADEVGLGKTIEAGLVLAQKWAERRRRIIIIVPASLRKQWNQEMLDKFFIPSVILEAKNFNQAIKDGHRNPFDDDRLVICSYHFARSKSDYLRQVPWDLVIIDEAHRLRNVYKKSNKIAREIRDALRNRPKILLTATPLQNSLMELYGLVSIIDEHVFGDSKSFQSQFGRLTREEDFAELRTRLSPICKRTLRKDVLEYIRYTNRVPITEPFEPSDAEQDLYELVSEYLRRPNLHALPNSQRALMTLVLRKLLASSTFAIAGAINSLAKKLRSRLEDNSERIKAIEELNDELADNFEELDEVSDEWAEDSDEEEVETQEILTEAETEAMKAEIAELESFRERAIEISQNAKGVKLLTALDKGFAESAKNGAAQKAIIFTESRLTQDYLLRILSETRFSDGIILFNGSNNDEKSKRVYTEWVKLHTGTDRVTGSRTADMRSALVDYFRNQGQIMIATEAAAEGINLQFCSMVVNYDMPWNPQRIEQRIGRCHRYGQKHDVVVVNFLNQRNAADRKVYEILEQKFKLFSGVFGASDEVLGSIESGVDFEKRIVAIYQNCRTEEQIQSEFDALRSELDEQISERMNRTKVDILEHFDVEVAEKLKLQNEKTKASLNRYEEWLFRITQFALRDRAEFIHDRAAFRLKDSPLPQVAPLGFYEMARHAKTGHAYRIQHPLAHHIISELKASELPPEQVTFHLSQARSNIAILNDFVGKEGWLSAYRLTLEGAEEFTEDYVLLSATCGEIELDQDQAFRLVTLLAESKGGLSEPSQLQELVSLRERQIDRQLALVFERNSKFFEDEAEKLDGWAEDMKIGLERELKQIDLDIKELKRSQKLVTALEEKTKIYREIKDLEVKRKEKRQRLFQAQDEIDEKKEALLETVEARLRQQQTVDELFTIHWKLA